MKTLHLICFTLLLLVTATVQAAVPPMINYQGKLLKPDGTPVTDGTYQMQFALYPQPAGGTAIWSEINPTVQVKKGLFSVLLGSINHLPDNIFDSPDRWFGITVGTDPEMTPRQQITTAAYAFKAAVADTVVDGAVTATKIADGTITNEKVANSANIAISKTELGIYTPWQDWPAQVSGTSGNAGTIMYPRNWTAR